MSWPIERESEVTYFSDGTICIVYDEFLYQKRLRFKIAHEIGHIVLYHYNFKNSDIYEKEAKMFAARLLMPMALIKKYKLDTEEKIIRYCNVSRQAALIRLERFNMLNNRNKFFSSRLEKKLKKQLLLKEV